MAGSPLPDVQSDDRHLLPVKLALILGLAALADWLFWSQRIGLSFVLFAIALFASARLDEKGQALPVCWIAWRRNGSRHGLEAPTKLCKPGCITTSKNSWAQSQAAIPVARNSPAALFANG